MCGRRKLEKKMPDFKNFYNKEMDFSLLEKISKETPFGITVQLHNNGEPLLYSRFGDAVNLFNNQIVNIVTNGKLLLKKYDEIVENLDTLSISVFENDIESEKQFEIIKKFLKKKGSKSPYTTLRLVGNVERQKYENLNTQIISRTLHSPMGSFEYRRDPTVPETGICLDFLNHLAINFEGNVSICVRFDPNKLGVIGNVKENTLQEIWNSEKRMEWKLSHIKGERNKVPLCSYCKFWGIPTGN